jgi:hypothetical protein
MCESVFKSAEHFYAVLVAEVGLCDISVGMTALNLKTAHT